MKTQREQVKSLLEQALTELAHNAGLGSIIILLAKAIQISAYWYKTTDQ